MSCPAHPRQPAARSEGYEVYEISEQEGSREQSWESLDEQESEPSVWRHGTRVEIWDDVSGSEREKAHQQRRPCACA